MNMSDNIIDITEDVKKAERKRRWAKRKQKIKDWWEVNKGYVILLAPIGASVIVKGCQTFNKYHTMRQDERNRDLRCYDASRGHYWELKRKLDNDDWLYINQSMKNGGTLGDALHELRALK